VIAESPADFATWVLGQRRPPPVPTDSLAGRGRALVESGTCQACHTIASTMAAGRVGPDLTHVASRLSIAAGTLRTSAPNLYRWILDPQVIKPGAQMPPSGLPPGSIRAVVAYLETLR
jgi:cytochrome c oxidase subunit 2